MQISQLDSSQAERFGSLHSLHYGLPNGQQVVILSGVVSVDLQAPGWTNENTVSHWFEKTVGLELALPADLLKDGQSFQIEQGVPSISLNAISGSTNVGWGVNGFELAVGETVRDGVRIQVHLGVSLSGEMLRRVSYHVTVLGRILD